MGGDGPKMVKLTLVKAEASFWKTLLSEDSEQVAPGALMCNKKDD